MSRASAVVDLTAIADNLSRIRDLAGPAQVMAVVKADAYGHGLVPVARAARAAGAEWLGVALTEEALELRSAGDTGPVLAWLWSPGDPSVVQCIDLDVDLAVSSDVALAEVLACVHLRGRPARIHVKVDTGLSRNGIGPAEWPDLLARIAAAQSAGEIEVVSIWSHLADGELPGASSVAAQADRFRQALSEAELAGVSAPLRHLSNSGGLFANPELRFDLVRTGIAMYGLTPAESLGTAHDLGLVPAMTLRARLANVKEVEAGTAVSYGGEWSAPRRTRLGLVPLGYADGIPRAAGGAVEVSVGGRRHPAVGRVAMDQFVVDLGDAPAEPGDEVVLFGPGSAGEMTADDWAARVGTIGYEIVTRVGPRVPREHVGGLGSAS